MTNEKLYEAIGDVSDEHIKKAKKGKLSIWLKWGTIAACLCMAVIWIFMTQLDSRGHSDDGNMVSSTIADVAPMVYINDTLYKQSVKQTFYAELKGDFIYLGKVESDITSNQEISGDGVPKENYQANIPIVGADVYQYGDDIVVQIEEKFWLYETLMD